MASMGRLAGIFSSVFVALILVVAGCQEQRAQVPAVQPEPVRSVPARASSEKVRGSKSPASSSDLALQTSNLKRQTSEETPRGVTTNENTPAVALTLKFVPGQAATYKVTTENQKSIEWKGSPTARPEQFTDGRLGHHVEITFEQRVRQVQEDGNAVLEITIQGLKYVGESANKIVLDFDSARPADAGNPLAKLVGKSYQVKMSPRGQVVGVSNVGPARQAVQGSLPGNNVAQKLLSDDEIRNRHEIVALSALKDPAVHPGQTWSNIKVFSFDELGAKTYERVYTLKQVGSGQLSVPGSAPSTANRPLPTDNLAGRQAVVEMKGIPSAAKAAELYQQRAGNPFAGMSDNADSYQGRLVFDLDSGQVREYGEQMQNEWIIFDPSSGQDPAAIRMAARRLYQLEQVQ
jgi:hypothetical protein